MGKYQPCVKDLNFLEFFIKNVKDIELVSTSVPLVIIIQNGFFPSSVRSRSSFPFALFPHCYLTLHYSAQMSLCVPATGSPRGFHPKRAAQRS